MTANASQQGHRVLSGRRIAILATVVGLGTAAMYTDYAFGPQAAGNALFAPAYAQTAQRPVGFADIVEKVKPAVISVRVKFDAARAGGNSLQDTPLDEFLRRFGVPNEGNNSRRQQTPPRNEVTGQGSGFFISADGYAVTNNHVVENADNVQVTADDGKTYTAKVIGSDSRSDVALIKVDGRGTFRS